jgi:hypothetical protein
MQVRVKSVGRQKRHPPATSLRGATLDAHTKTRDVDITFSRHNLEPSSKLGARMRIFLSYLLVFSPCHVCSLFAKSLHILSSFFCASAGRFERSSKLYNNGSRPQLCASAPPLRVVPLRSRSLQVAGDRGGRSRRRSWWTAAPAWVSGMGEKERAAARVCFRSKLLSSDLVPI